MTFDKRIALPIMQPEVGKSRGNSFEGKSGNTLTSRLTSETFLPQFQHQIVKERGTIHIMSATPARKSEKPSHHDIAGHAYFHWLQHGAVHGHDKEHWFAAETELMQQELGEKGIVWARNTHDLKRGLETVSR
jgi:hypothetical protein